MKEEEDLWYNPWEHAQPMDYSIEETDSVQEEELAAPAQHSTKTCVTEEGTPNQEFQNHPEANPPFFFYTDALFGMGGRVFQVQYAKGNECPRTINPCPDDPERERKEISRASPYEGIDYGPRESKGGHDKTHSQEQEDCNYNQDSKWNRCFSQTGTPLIGFMEKGELTIYIAPEKGFAKMKNWSMQEFWHYPETYILKFQKLIQLYRKNVAGNWVITNQPIAQKESRCDNACNREHHHFHWYYKRCKRNPTLKTITSNCLSKYDQGKIKLRRNANFLTNQLWWTRPVAVWHQNGYPYLKILNDFFEKWFNEWRWLLVGIANSY